MQSLINQPNRLPTRKIAAVIISGMVTGGIQAALGIFWPEHPLAPLLDQLDIWVQAGVMVAAGYFVRDRA